MRLCGRKAARQGRARLSRSARSFIEAYEPKAFVVVNRGVSTSESVEATNVRWTPPQEVVSSLSDLLS
jgi:hypothetical protein